MLQSNCLAQREANLYYSFAELTRIDSALNQCTSLTALDLSFNSLSGVGGLDANAMCKLKKLDLSCNKLTNIGISFGTCCVQSSIRQ